MKKLFYTSPAKVWNEALPLGNGRLGAMVYGDPFCECLDLNEDTLWSGSPRMGDAPHSMETVRQIRQLHEEGKYQEALDNLKSVSDDARAYNSTGVALMMQGQFEEAISWFEKALDYDHSEAQNNIDAINAEYRYENDQKAAIEEYLKKFE
jgi:alpha-L-fucosidase 2